MFARIAMAALLTGAAIGSAGAQIRIDGFAEPFEGRLRAISNEAAFTPYYALTQRDRSRLSYLAEVDVTSPGAAELPTGIPVEVTFELEAPELGLVR